MLLKWFRKMKKDSEARDYEKAFDEAMIEQRFHEWHGTSPNKNTNEAELDIRLVGNLNNAHSNTPPEGKYCLIFKAIGDQHMPDFPDTEVLVLGKSAMALWRKAFGWVYLDEPNSVSFEPDYWQEVEFIRPKKDHKGVKNNKMKEFEAASEAKNINPKEPFGVRKPCISVLSMSVLAEMGLGMMEGGMKYGRHNYRRSPIKASTYIDAVFRHLFLQWWEGEDIDEASQLNHVIKALSALHVLRDAMIQGTWIDDRPPKVPEEHARFLQDRVDEIFRLHPTETHQAPVTELNKEVWKWKKK